MVCSHSRLKQASNSRLASREDRAARAGCYKHFGSFVKEVLDGNSQQINPGFSGDSAHQYLLEVYHSCPQIFVQPQWMPAPPCPRVEMDCSSFSGNEVSQVVKKMKSTSAPSPFDRVGYIILKKYPALIPLLIHLFNICWAQSTLPREWKSAAIKLIAKNSATEDPNNPANFRPITLTPCISKIFTTLLRNRWLRYMTANGLLNSSL